MNKKILEEYKKKIKLINKYNKFYYDKSKPLVLDKDYDDLKNYYDNAKNDAIFK